jgi:glutamine amidotransferase
MNEQKIVIIDYQMGNIKNVQQAMTHSGFTVEVSDSFKEIEKASGLILPGVGAYRDAIEILAKKGLDRVLKEIIQQGKPILGICLGMQLLFSLSEENGLYPGLDIIPGRVVRFSSTLRVPHLGWNQVYYPGKELREENILFSGIKSGTYFYFVHSYYCIPEKEETIIAHSYYQQCFVSAVRRGRVFGVQFHPEKSSTQGLKLLKNFGEICHAYYSGN